MKTLSTFKSAFLAVLVLVAMAVAQYTLSNGLSRDSYGIVAANMATVNLTTSQGFPLDSSGRLAIDCANGCVTGPGSSVSGDLPSFNGAGGSTLQDSGIPASATWLDWGRGFSTSNTVAANTTTSHAQLWGIVIDTPVTASQISVGVHTADNSSNTYDLCLYYGVSGSSDALILNTTAVAGSSYYATGSDAWTTIPFTQGSKLITPGRYYLMWYGNENSAPAILDGNNSGNVLFYHLSSFSITPASGGCPASITGPADGFTTSATPHFVLH